MMMQSFDDPADDFSNLRKLISEVSAQMWVRCHMNQGVRTGGEGKGPLSQFLDSGKKVRFQQTHNQGLPKLFLKVSWDLSTYHGTLDGVSVSL